MTTDATDGPRARMVICMPHGLMATFEATGKEQLATLQRPWLYILADWLDRMGVDVPLVEFTMPDGQRRHLVINPDGDADEPWDFA